MPLKLISGMLKASGDEGMLVMDTDGMSHIVLITKEALLDVASPPRCDECRLQQYITTFSNIASDKYDRGELGADGRILITSADIAEWKQLH